MQVHTLHILQTCSNACKGVFAINLSILRCEIPSLGQIHTQPSDTHTRIHTVTGTEAKARRLTLKAIEDIGLPIAD